MRVYTDEQRTYAKWYYHNKIKTDPVKLAKKKLQRVEAEKRRTRTYTKEYVLWKTAKRRAKAKKLPFSIKPTDIIIPTICPVLGIELKGGTRKSHADAPSLDRLIPSKGYVVGNLTVMSYRANTLKSNGTIAELEKVLAWMKRYGAE